MTYPADIDEWRSAVRSMSETQRIAACEHSARNGRVCPDCGDEVDL